jgi:hypothetical protein
LKVILAMIMKAAGGLGFTPFSGIMDIRVA